MPGTASQRKRLRGDEDRCCDVDGQRIQIVRQNVPRRRDTVAFRLHVHGPKPMTATKNAYIRFKTVEKFRDESFRTPLLKEPRRSYEQNRQIWRSAAGGVLVEIAVETGWFRVYHSEEEGTFWLMEIEGPDHGVHFYGPFPDSELPLATEQP